MMMSGSSIHADEFHITHLIREALKIPEGFYEEVYFDPQTYTIDFSPPLMPSRDTTLVGDSYKVGYIHALRIDEFAGLKTVNGGGIKNSASVEVDVDSIFYDAFADIDKEIVTGKYYVQAVYIGWDDALDRIANFMVNYDVKIVPPAMKERDESRYCYHLMYLFEKIMRRAEAQKTAN